VNIFFIYIGCKIINFQGLVKQRLEHSKETLKQTGKPLLENALTREVEIEIPQSVQKVAEVKSCR